MGDFTNIGLQGDFVPTMNEEASFWLSEQIPSKNAYVELTGYEAMLKIVTGMSSRIFVGQSLSKDQRWLRMIVEYTMDVFLISTALRPYPAILRPLIAYVSASPRTIAAYIVTMPLIYTTSSETRRKLSLIEYLTVVIIC